MILQALKSAGIRTEAAYPLAQSSSFRIGGRARLALFPDTREQMLSALRILAASDTPFWIIGNASNVVFPDEGFDGAVLFTSAFRELTVENENVRAGAGVTLSQIALAARDASLGGAAFAYGIPATLGGAVFMNAGAFGGCMADICESTLCYDLLKGELITLSAAEQAFGYRSSIYEKTARYAILEATLSLKAADRNAVDADMKRYLAHRKATQPLEYPSAGSVFKRPQGHYAGKLIEDCGLKGLRIGGAEVSQKHAGFIVNRGGATAADVKALVAEIQACVLQNSGVQLECEIRFL